MTSHPGSTTRLAAFSGVLFACAIVILLNRPVVAKADCDCKDDGQCVFQTCCYMIDDCKPTGDTQNPYKKCWNIWDPQLERFFCSNGNTCEGIPCKAPE